MPDKTQKKQSDDVRQTLIPTKNMPALLSYYFGVFGLIPLLGLPLSVAAIVSGLIGMRKYKMKPTPGAKGHAVTGIVLGVLELVVFVFFIFWISSAN